MRARDILAHREFKQFEQELVAEERAQAYEAKRPEREAGGHIIALRAEADSWEHEKLLGKRRDPRAFLDDYSAEIQRFATDFVQEAFNREQIDHFKQAHPGVWTPELRAMMARYFEVNDIRAASYAVLRHLVDRIRDAGLMPQPKPALAVTPAPKQPVRMALPVQPAKPTPLVGRDQETGEMREFSNFEVERMSAETFKRTFQLIGENRPAYLAARW